MKRLGLKQRGIPGSRTGGEGSENSTCRGESREKKGSYVHLMLHNGKQYKNEKKRKSERVGLLKVSDASSVLLQSDGA